VLLATPEYNQSVPGVLKNAIDWLSRPLPDEPLAGKPVAIVGASSGPWGTRLAQAALRQVLNATDALVLPGPALYVRSAPEQFDRSGEIVDGAVADRMRAVLAAFATWIDVASAARRRSA
jgi:chromate reductase, NAD(P)H dehydrogenase (quinone)